MTETQWAVCLLGGLTLLGVFLRMNSGFGPMNLRATGIVLIATFATLLGLQDGQGLSAAMGILGAIAGYLFSIKERKGSCNNEKPDPPSDADKKR